MTLKYINTNDLLWMLMGMMTNPNSNDDDDSADIMPCKLLSMVMKVWKLFLILMTWILRMMSNIILMICNKTYQKWRTT